MAPSSSARIRGRIKEEPEDFRVEEITESGVALEAGRRYAPGDLGFSESPTGKFTMLVVQKRNWNTAQALKAIANTLGRGMRAIGFAGTKDRVAESVQLATIFGADPAAAMGIRIKDISVNGAWKCDSRISIGELSGNRFTIRVRGTANADAVASIERSMGGVFPNMFGSQRFGVRGNNDKIGLDMLKGDFESAVMRFLTDSGTETNGDAIAARVKLRDSYDFAGALKEFPLHLKYERSAINYLAAHDGDYVGALKSMPRQLTLMFVHSVEDAIFNAEVADRISSGEGLPMRGDMVCRTDPARFYDIGSAREFDGSHAENELTLLNILGYNTERVTEFERERMDELGIELSDFKVRGMTELGCKGSMRVMLAPYKGFSATSEGENAVIARFSLPAGSYATVLLGMLVDYDENRHGSAGINTFTEKPT